MARDLEKNGNAAALEIRIEGLSMGFEGQSVLKGLDLEIRRGETVVILGASGSGKSVLMKLIIGLLKPDAGRIIIQGEDVTSFVHDREWNALRLKMGFLFQGSSLYDSMTVGENVSFALEHHFPMSPDKIREVVHQKLSLVELEGVENKMPSELSGGMQKRAALARAIAMDPTIMMYDEPTAGLDPIRGKHITELILRLQREMTVTSLVVTHDLICASAIADRIALLHQGDFVFIGTVMDLRKSSEPYVRRFIEASTLTC